MLYNQNIYIIYVYFSVLNKVHWNVLEQCMLMHCRHFQVKNRFGYVLLILKKHMEHENL